MRSASRNSLPLLAFLLLMPLGCSNAPSGHEPTVEDRMKSMEKMRARTGPGNAPAIAPLPPQATEQKSDGK